MKTVVVVVIIIILRPLGKATVCCPSTCHPDKPPLILFETEATQPASRESAERSLPLCPTGPDEEAKSSRSSVHARPTGEATGGSWQPRLSSKPCSLVGGLGLSSRFPEPSSAGRWPGLPGVSTRLLPALSNAKPREAREGANRPISCFLSFFVCFLIYFIQERRIES